MRRLIPVLALLAAACSEGGGGITIDDRTGVVRGMAYVDRNADGTYTAGPDATAAGVVAALLLDATGDTVARTTTAADGTFLLTQVPIGRYRFVAAHGALGDSIEVQDIGTSVFSLAANDTVVRQVRFGYPATSIGEARALPGGTRVVIDGVALNSWAVFADSTLHVRDATGSLRAIRVQPATVQAGDSVRLIGVTGISGGAVILADANVRVLTPAVGLAPADSVSTLDASTAIGGTRQDGHVRVAGAIVQDTGRIGNDRLLGVSDGSGRLEVLLDANVQFDAGPYVPGATFTGGGVLVPAGGGAWRLKPRSREEAVITFPSMSIALARTSPQGLRVVIQGVSLNNWTAFGDSTVHMMDESGWLRAVRVLGPVAAGDSVRLLGTIGTRDGQPVITAVTPTLIRAGVGIPAPDSISTAQAAAAAGGRDAALVRIAGPIVAAQTLPNGDMVIGVNDGSGLLEVVLDDALPVPSGVFLPGAIMRATGLLVPTGTGWQLKPRSIADATAAFPTVTISEARALPVGRTVFIEGVALNAWATFGDQSVHLADGTDVMRTIGVPSTQLLAGDSVRILGTVTARNGQPVLNATSAVILLTGVGLPPVDSVTTVIAATAEAAVRDADQVAVSGTISAVTPRQNGEVALTVSDGSGDLIVLLDPDTGILTGSFAVGMSVRVRGLLIPTASGTFELKPRSAAEIQVNTP